MNTIGKILVVLNLIFAVVVGGFLVIDFATRSNWKQAYEKLQREMQVAEKNTNTSGRTLQELNNQVKRAEVERDELRLKLTEQETVAKAMEENKNLLIKEALEKAKDADLSAQAAIGEKNRLKEEVKGLTVIVQSRDKYILELQDSNKKFRTEAIAQAAIAAATQSRNEHLLGQVQDLTRKMALRDAGVGGEGTVAKDPNAPNPPPVYVKGKIEKINPDDRGLVQISVGSDQGLNKYHTLEVYRLNPRPEYLGMIRIVDAEQHKAIGRLMRANLNKGALQEGDIVASSLTNQAP